MKRPPYLLVIVLALIAMLISACGSSAGQSAPDTSSAGGGSKQAMPVAFTGVIESINGNEWSINGQTITVDPAVVRDGPFNVGDTVKVEVQVQADGSMVVNSVETPAPAVAVVVPSSSPDASGTPESFLSSPNTPESVSISTPEPAPSNSPDIQNQEAFGTVTSISDNTIVIGGKTYQFANNAEIKNQIQNGASVKVHFILNADGSMTITEIQNFVHIQATGDNSSNDNSGSNSVSHDQNNGNSGSGSNDSHNDSSGSGSNDNHDNDSGSDS